MLRILRQGQRWILWFVIIVVGAVFVIYLGLPGMSGPAPGSGVVVQVDGRRYYARDVQRLREVQEDAYRRQLGPDFNISLLGDSLDQGAAQELLQQGLLAREAEQMGLQVTDLEVREFLRRIPGAADAQGRLDREVITNFAERQFGSLRRFQETLRDQLLADKVRLLLRESVIVSDGEVRAAVRLRSEEAEIAYVALDAERLQDSITFDDAEVTALLAEERDRVRNLYEERLDEFDRPEQVRARHILIRLAPDADDDAKAAAQRRAAEALERIRNGEDFATVAGEVSEDPGSAKKGGDLGFFARGAMVPAFEDVAFSLEPGETSEVFPSTFGLHVMRTEERRAAEKTPFEAVQEDLARDLLRRDGAALLAREHGDALVEAVRAGESLTDAARERSLTLERPDPLKRRPDGNVPGLGAAPDLVEAVFAIEEAPRSSDRIFEIDGKLVLFELLSRSAASEEEVDALLAETREELLDARRQAAQQSWVADRAEKLRESGKLVFDLTALARR